MKSSISKGCLRKWTSISGYWQKIPSSKIYRWRILRPSSERCHFSESLATKSEFSMRIVIGWLLSLVLGGRLLGSLRAVGWLKILRGMLLLRSAQLGRFLYFSLGALKMLLLSKNMSGLRKLREIWRKNRNI